MQRLCWSRLLLPSFAARGNSGSNSRFATSSRRPQSTTSGGGGADGAPPSSSTANYPRVPLSEPFPLTSRKSASTAAAAAPVPESDPRKQLTTVTTLSNGLRVATEPNYGQYCTLGLIVDSGSRYEVAHPSGISHFLEKLAFNSTQKFTDPDEISTRLEKHGGICDCQATRDTVVYAASVETKGLETAMEILGDVALRPRLTDEEMEYTRCAVEFEIEDINMRPDQEILMNEAIHAAAFSNNTLGLPKVCPVENIKSIDRDVLLNYLAQYHTPDRMVVAAVGVDHDRLVDAAQRHLVDDAPIWKKQKPTSTKVDTSLAQYTGGLVTIPKDLSNASLGPTPLPNLAHLTLGLEAVSHQHQDFIAFCVLNMLMGGGGSFSAGGPGKGMYTRLYTSVLNRHHWMYEATAFNHAYGDSGLFCIKSSGPPEKLAEMTGIIASEISRLASPLGDEEFNRAKKQLTSMLLMNLESRPVIFEDVARQVLAQGERKRPEEYIERIAEVRAEDVNRIAEKMLASKPSVAAIGDLTRLPDMKEVELGLLARNKKKKTDNRILKF